MADLATVDDLAAFLGKPVDAESAALALAGVSGLVRGYTNRAFAPVAGEVERADGTGARSLLLSRLPVDDVVSVVEDPDGAATDLVVGTAVEWSEDGILRRIDGGLFARRLRFYAVTYDHGTTSPDDLAWLRLFVCRIVSRAIVNPEGLTQENVAGYGSTFGFDATRLATLSQPDRDEIDRRFRVTV